jgi:hypothetical protein
MDSEEIARHIREQERLGKRGSFESEKRHEKYEVLRKIQKFAEREDFEGFSALLDTLNVTDVDRRRVAIAQFYQMVSDCKRKERAKPQR